MNNNHEISGTWLAQRLLMRLCSCGHLIIQIQLVFFNLLVQTVAGAGQVFGHPRHDIA